jgi:hypothetical protein
MWRSAGLAVLVLTGSGLLLLLAGGAGIFTGLFLAERIHALLPREITSDAAAIGGAALALGAGLMLAGVGHLVLAATVRRGRLLVAAIVACAVMAAILLGWAVAALVSAAAGDAPAAAMVPAGLGLTALALAYAWSGAIIMEQRRTLRDPI